MTLPMPSTAVAARIVPHGSATRLRLATAGDALFIRELFHASRADVFLAAGLPQATLDMLLQQQFQAQARGYAAQFPDAISLIVLEADEPVGKLTLLTGDRCWRIVDIALLPVMRGRGIGTDVIDAVLRAATAEGAREVTLSVLFDNIGARRLYDRLGFSQTGEGLHIPMVKQLLQEPRTASV